MIDSQAKKQLRKMLRSFTAGTILHLLAEVFQESAEEARRGRDKRAFRQCQDVAAALFVTGLGIDLACPRE